MSDRSTIVGIENTSFVPISPATSSNQTDGSQKTQIVDGDGDVVSVTGNKLDVNATLTSSAMTIADGGDVTQGAKADAKSTVTDTTPVTMMSVLKEISYMEQNPASRVVTATDLDIRNLTSVSDSIALEASTKFGSDNAIGISGAKYSLQSHFEAITDWVESTGADNIATTTSHRGTGTNNLTFDKVAGDADAMISKTISTFDMSAYSTHAIGIMHAYISDLTNVAKCFVRIGTNSSHYWQYDFADSILSAGWNQLQANIAMPTSQTGNGANLSAITYLAFGVTFDGAANTLVGIITGGWGIKRVLETSTIINADVAVDTAWVGIKDRNSNDRLDVASGTSYNYLYNRNTDGTNLMPTMDASARAGHQVIYGSDDGGTTKRVIKTDSGGAIQVDIEVDNVTVDNAGGASAVNIQDGGNTITVDGTVAVTNADMSTVAGAVSGGHMQVDVVSAPSTVVTASNLDIRDLTSASDSVAAVCTNAGTFAVQAAQSVAANLNCTEASASSIKTAVELIDNAVDGNYLNTNINCAGTDVPAGGGVEAAALRVTIASDSTGLLSVDDNGGALSIDIGGQAPQLDDTDKLAVSLYGKGTNAGDTALDCDADGHLQVDVLSGGGGGEQYTDGTVVDAGYKGNIILGSDGANYQVLLTDSSGNLQVESNSAAIATETTLGNIKTAVEIMDDWDDSNYCNVNLNIAGTDVSANAGVNTAQTQRVTIATDDEVNNSLASIDGKITACNTGAVVVSSGAVTETNSASIKTAVELIDNAVDGSYLNTNMNVAGTDVAAGTGAQNAQTLRVVLATDQAQLTNKLLVTEDSASAIKTAVEIMDDWDDSNYCNVNMNIAGTDLSATAPMPVRPNEFELAGVTTHVKKYYTNAGAVTDGIIWSPAGGKRWYVTDIFIGVSAASTVTLEDDLAGGDSPVFKMEFAANSGWSHSFSTPWYSGEDAADLIITTTAGNVFCTVTGYEI